MNQSISLESELENLLRAIEEIVQIIISIEQKKNAIAQSNNDAEKSRLNEEMKEDINQLSNKQNDLNLVKNSLNEPGILRENENMQTEQISQDINENINQDLGKNVSSIQNDKLTSAQENEKSEIAKELESIASDAETLATDLSEDTVKYSSLLNSLGQNILLFDQRLEALKTRMQYFFENIPESLKTNTALFFINRLENVNSKIQALKDKISENIQSNEDLSKPGNKDLDSEQNNLNKDATLNSDAQEDIEYKKEFTVQETIEQVPDVGGISLPSSDDSIIKEEQKLKVPAFQTARQMIVSQNGNEFFTIKQLISGIQTSTTALQHEIAVKEQSFIQNEKQNEIKIAEQNKIEEEYEQIKKEQSVNQWELER